MANIFSNPSVIATESLMHLEDNLILGNLIARDKTSDFTQRSNGYKVGQTISINTNPDYVVKEFLPGGTIVKQDIRESTRSMSIEKLLDVSVEVSSRELRMNFRSFSEQVIQPATFKLAQKVDQLIGEKIAQGAGLYTSTTLLESAADMALSRKAATLQQLGRNRFALTNLDLEAKLLGQEWLNQSQTRGGAGETQLSSANIGRVMNMDFYSSINFPSIATHTGGTGVGVTKTAPTATENLVGQKVLVLNAAATGTFQDGDRIFVAGMRRPLIVDGTQATPTAIAIVDPITEIVPITAAVTVISSGNAYTVQGAIFDEQSLAMAMPLLDPASDKPSAVASNSGFSIRTVMGYDQDIKSEVLSLDLLIGTACYDPRRITLLADY